MGATAPSSSDLVLIVPGLAPGGPGDALERLTSGLAQNLKMNRPGWKILSWTRQSEGVNEAIVEVTSNLARTGRIELRELAWLDVRPSMGDVSVYERLRRGAVLVRYWLSFWRRPLIPRSSASLRRWIVGGSVALLVWYFLVILAAVLLAATEVPDTEVPHWIDAKVSGWLSASAKITLVAVLAALGWKKVVDLVDVTWTAFAFLRADTAANPNTFRIRTRRRMHDFLHKACADTGSFRRIWLVSHSFGTVVAADGIAWVDPASLPGIRVKMLTLGSPLEFLNCRDPEIQQIVRKCSDSSLLNGHWEDYYDEKDAFCSGISSLAKDDRRIISKHVNLGFSWKENVLGNAHNGYYSSPEINLVIVTPFLSEMQC